MPDSNGKSTSGGWVNKSDNVNSCYVPQSLELSGKANNQPKEYVASGSIDIYPGFISADGDDFTAYNADGTYAGGSGGSSVNGWSRSV
ncbi:hypothetical protein [Chitinophaga sp. Cy-1792]|uniref:hypothetical protein n=1 Tax=Chitinophaga sp. Cy-1792 TaxID=2608339 RepID=UPI00141EDFBF|nr:hypothetical protein [Chitinophaga sp. Cy-1792]NIG52805.1 hypothetical protein [Chitinophaga sp. Cy-1792]